MFVSSSFLPKFIVYVSHMLRRYCHCCQALVAEWEAHSIPEWKIPRLSPEDSMMSTLEMEKYPPLTDAFPHKNNWHVYKELAYLKFIVVHNPDSYISCVVCRLSVDLVVWLRF